MRKIRKNDRKRKNRLEYVAKGRNIVDSNGKVVQTAPTRKRALMLARHWNGVFEPPDPRFSIRPIF